MSASSADSDAAGFNSTSHKAEVYDAEVRRTIPYHYELLNLAVDVALASAPAPAAALDPAATTPLRWLDTGCGPGRLTQIARARAPATFFVLADPSTAMLELARARHADLPAECFLLCPSDALPEDAPPFDVITAMQCHHYYAEPGGRKRAVARCFARLAPGGVLVVSENVRADSERGHALQRSRWASWQAAQGRAPAEVEAHLAREGVAFYPLRVDEHFALLREAGFEGVELVWRAHGQAAFVAFKPSL